MPEGDTIFRAADVLRAALVGRRVTAARAQAQPGMRRVPDLSRLAGTTVTSVEPRGKHLLIGFDNGLTVRTHLRMSGSWHRYRPGEPWRRPRREASAILETADAVAVAFNTPVVELLTDADLHRSRPLRELGPDLLSRTFDLGEAVRRLRERDADELGSALLDSERWRESATSTRARSRSSSGSTRGLPSLRSPTRTWSERCAPHAGCCRRTRGAARA
jgi:endonuclease-8